MSITTSALVLQQQDAPFTVEEIKLEPLQENEVLVDMVASGICHTDLAVQYGHLPAGGFPIVVGHEGSGIIKEVGSEVTHVRPGDKVLLSFASCGQCPTCQDQHTAYCSIFHPMNFGSKRLDGSFVASAESGPLYARFFGQSSFAKSSIVHATSAVPLPGATDEELRQLAPLGCGLMTGAGAVLNIFKAEKGRSIAIFGAGGVGFGALFGARVAGLNPIIVVDIAQGRLELAKELGATHVINGKTEKDVAGKIKEITDGYGVKYSVETTGNAQVQAQCVNCVGKLAQVAVIGTTGTASFNVPTETYIQTGVQLLGVAMGDAYTPQFIPRLVDEYRAGRFPVNRLTKFYKPGDVNQATQEMLSGDVIKPILVWR